jgi:1,4-alpha-glucan branching enzyme
MKFQRFLLTGLFLLYAWIINLYGQDHHDWSYNLSIYEVNVRQYTSAGTFSAFETHLDRLKNMGVGILWFMPIHPIGVQNRLGSLGSYYSVKDYYGINPEFGTLDDFKDLVDSIHAKGMYVLMDWVGNHTAWDNPLTLTHPEWYVKNNNGDFTPPPGTDWTDVIQLDYSKPELRTYMINAMKYWINETGIDGFRCDAVSFVPIDFWTTAITELKSFKPDIFMLAEGDGTQYVNAGFDMSYGWGWLGFGEGILVNIVNGTNTANFINGYNTLENTNYPGSHYRMYFTSNHDENSWYGTVYELFGNATEIFAVLTSTFRSMPLIYSGQEAGLDHRLAFFDKDEITWHPHPFEQIYSALLHLKKENKALWNGSAGGQLQRVLTTNNPAIFAFVREKENCRIFEICNLTSSSQTFTLLGSLYFGTYRDAFSGDSILFAENAEITLPAWGYKVYETGSGITGVEKNDPAPEGYALDQNYPNPFNPTTNFGFRIPASPASGSDFGFVSLKVYDVLGNEAAVLMNEMKPAGRYQINFNAEGLSSGVYFYVINVNGYTASRKMILLK